MDPPWNISSTTHSFLCPVHRHSQTFSRFSSSALLLSLLCDVRLLHSLHRLLTPSLPSSLLDTVYPVFQVQLIFSFQFQIQYKVQRQSTQRQHRHRGDDRARQTQTVPRWVCFHATLKCTQVKPSLSHEKDETETPQTRERKMRDNRFCQRSFINIGSCVKASAPRLGVTSLKPTTPP